MSNTVSKLNEVLAVERACVQTLQRGEGLSVDIQQQHLIRRLRADCEGGCSRLSGIVSGLNGIPADHASARYTLRLDGETFLEAIDLVQSAHQHIVDEISLLIDDLELKAVRGRLVELMTLHKSGIESLKSLRGS